jgi:hypothetical protein
MVLSLDLIVAELLNVMRDRDNLLVRVTKLEEAIASHGLGQCHSQAQRLPAPWEVHGNQEE